MLCYTSAIYERVLAICSISGALKNVILSLRTVVQARKIAPFSQEDMNHITQTVAELSKEIPRILCTILLTMCLTLEVGCQSLFNHLREV